jgi:hypothetical protein
MGSLTVSSRCRRTLLHTGRGFLGGICTRDGWLGARLKALPGQDILVEASNGPTRDGTALESRVALAALRV